MQPTPFTAWLDFQSFQSAKSNSETTRRALPIWLESVQIHAQKSDDGRVEKTTFRLRFRRIAGLNNELLLRVFFDDTTNAAQRPQISVWNEIGTRLLAPHALGAGVGLAVSDTLMIPMAGVDYIDIETPGDGSNIRGALLSSVQKAETRSAVDFSAPPQIVDPFDNAPATTPAADDAFLFGRVKATLDAGTIFLGKENHASGVWDFELAKPPLVAMVTFEISNTVVTAPPQIILNNQALGATSMALPDLADPAFAGSIHPGDVSFRYNGWLKCQKAFSGSLLRAGLNHLQITNSRSDAGAVAIRALEVQLKYSTSASTP